MLLVFLQLMQLIILSFQKVASLKNRVDSALIPAAKKADIRSKIALLLVLQLSQLETFFFFLKPLISIYAPSILLLNLVLEWL